MSDTLYDLKVNDRQSFSKFIALLRQDYINNSESWENKTLSDFLEAMSAYSENIQGYYDNSGQNINADEPNWGTFADIFKGAKNYE